MYIEGDVPSVVTTTGGNGGNSGFGYGNDAWVLIILFALIFGWGRNGFGGGQGGFSGIPENYALATDFATIERKIDSVNAGLCDGFYATAQGINGVQQTLCQGFSGINQNIVTNGYETRLGITGLSNQLASCCCDLRAGQAETRYADLLNTKAIQEQIAKCCCENEKATMQLSYNLAQQNCGTLQAIDKLGDRIIDYMNANEKQSLRDENFALRLRASQEAQNNFLLNELKPCPSAAYIVPNPNCCYNYNVSGVGYNNNGCGCC